MVFPSFRLRIGNRYLPILVMAPVFLDGFFYYFISEFCVLLALQCSDRESSLVQNGGLSAACCSTSRCVLVSCCVLVSRCVFR